MKKGGVIVKFHSNKKRNSHLSVKQFGLVIFQYILTWKKKKKKKNNNNMYFLAG